MGLQALMAAAQEADSQQRRDAYRGTHQIDDPYRPSIGGVGSGLGNLMYGQWPVDETDSYQVTPDMAQMVMQPAGRDSAPAPEAPGPFGRSVQQDMGISGTPYPRAPSIRALEAQIEARMARAQAAGRTYEEQNQFEYMMSRAQQAPSSVTPSRPPARKKPAGKSPAPSSGSSEKFEMPKPRKYSQRDPFQKPATAQKKAKPKPRNVDPPSGYGRGSVNDREVTYPLARKRRK